VAPLALKSSFCLSAAMCTLPGSVHGGIAQPTCTSQICRPCMLAVHPTAYLLDRITSELTSKVVAPASPCGSVFDSLRPCMLPVTWLSPCQLAMSPPSTGPAGHACITPQQLPRLLLRRVRPLRKGHRHACCCLRLTQAGIC
jgi:hypothetical protein